MVACVNDVLDYTRSKAREDVRNWKGYVLKLIQGWMTGQQICSEQLLQNIVQRSHQREGVNCSARESQQRGSGGTTNCSTLAMTTCGLSENPEKSTSLRTSSFGLPAEEAPAFGHPVDQGKPHARTTALRSSGAAEHLGLHHADLLASNSRATRGTGVHSYSNQASLPYGADHDIKERDEVNNESVYYRGEQASSTSSMLSSMGPASSKPFGAFAGASRVSFVNRGSTSSNQNINRGAGHCGHIGGSTGHIPAPAGHLKSSMISYQASHQGSPPTAAVDTYCGSNCRSVALGQSLGQSVVDCYASLVAASGDGSGSSGHAHAAAHASTHSVFNSPISDILNTDATNGSGRRLANPSTANAASGSQKMNAVNRTSDLNRDYWMGRDDFSDHCVPQHYAFAAYPQQHSQGHLYFQSNAQSMQHSSYHVRADRGYSDASSFAANPGGESGNSSGANAFANGPGRMYGAVAHSSNVEQHVRDSEHNSHNIGQRRSSLDDLYNAVPSSRYGAQSARFPNNFGPPAQQQTSRFDSSHSRAGYGMITKRRENQQQLHNSRAVGSAVGMADDVPSRGTNPSNAVNTAHRY